MAKRFKGEDGKVYIEKKPFYKKQWVWLVVVLILGIGSLLGEDTTIPSEYKSASNKADSYAHTMHMSKAETYDQLISEFGEQFTPEEADYAISNVN